MGQPRIADAWQTLTVSAASLGLTDLTIAQGWPEEIARRMQESIRDTLLPGDPASLIIAGQTVAVFLHAYGVAHAILQLPGVAPRFALDAAGAEATAREATWEVMTAFDLVVPGVPRPVHVDRTLGGAVAALLLLLFTGRRGLEVLH